jgi:photoactive yellow protein
VSASSELPRFDDEDLCEVLDAGGTDLDDLPFGVILMDRTGDVKAYNAFESRRAGIGAQRVLGRNFFLDVGPCTNNYLVAQRFEDARDGSELLDEQLDYVFTFRMRPTPVRLRLMARPGSDHQYLVIRPR